MTQAIRATVQRGNPHTHQGREQQVESPPRHPQTTANNGRVGLRVRFILHDGTELFPLRMKSRQSGKVAFRLSDGGAGGNTIENTTEVEDEAEMVVMVCKQEKAVRLLSADGSRQGLYRKGGRSVRSVELDGMVI